MKICSRANTAEDRAGASSSTAKSFMRLFQLVLCRPSSEPGMPSSDADPLPVRVNDADIQEKRQKNEVSMCLSMEHFCTRKYPSHCYEAIVAREQSVAPPGTSICYAPAPPPPPVPLPQSATTSSSTKVSSAEASLQQVTQVPQQKKKATSMGSPIARKSQRNEVGMFFLF